MKEVIERCHVIIRQWPMTFFIIIIILFWSYFFACRQDPDSFSVYWTVYISLCIICLHWWWICVRMQRKISSFFASKSSREDEVSPTEVAESPPPATVSPGPSSSMVSSDSFQLPYPDIGLLQSASIQRDEGLKHTLLTKTWEKANLFHRGRNCLKNRKTSWTRKIAQQHT